MAQRAAEAIAALLEDCAQHPAECELLLRSEIGGPPGTLDQADDAFAAFVTLFIPPPSTSHGVLPGVVVDCLGGGLLHVLQERLALTGPAGLPAIADQILYLLVVPVLGVDGLAAVGTFATAPKDGLTSHHRHLAVRDSNGEILVANTIADRVDVYTPTSGGATLLTSFGTGTLVDPYGLAIDQSDGAVYVTDAGNSRIVKYTTDNAATPTFTRVNAPDFTSPAQGTAADEIDRFDAALAVGPTATSGSPTPAVTASSASTPTAATPARSSTGPARPPRPRPDLTASSPDCATSRSTPRVTSSPSTSTATCSGPHPMT